MKTLSLLLLTLVATVVPACAIVFGSPTVISSGADILTQGDLVWAVNFGGPSAREITVAGVTFVPFAVGTGNTTQTISNGTITVSTYSTGPYVRGLTGLGLGANLTPAYQSLLSEAVGTNQTTSAFSLTISGLTIGTQYLVQFFVQDSRASQAGAGLVLYGTGGSANLDYTDTNTAGGHGQFVIADFTADRESEIFVFKAAIGAVPTLNALQMRTIPEPSSSLLLLGAGAFLTLLARFPRDLAARV